MDQLGGKNESNFLLFGSGIWRDFIATIPTPVIAVGNKDIYSVLVRGSQFELRFEGVAEKVEGFFTTRFVAASNVRQAEQAAFRSVITEWNKKGLYQLSGVEPILHVEELNCLSERFHLRSGRGFMFFPNDGDEN